MAAANSIASTGIVLEPLRKGNYENWSTLVRNYLVGQGLWQGIVVGPPKRDGGENDDEWTSKNAKALHAIQLACGSETLSSIRTFENANQAWSHLNISFSEAEAGAKGDNEGRWSDEEAEAESECVDSAWIKELHSVVKEGNWNAAKAYIDRYGVDAILSTRPPLDRTILHVAVASGREKIVKELVEMGNQRLLRMQDKRGYTALALAAELTDNKDVAEWMIHKGGKELLTIKTKDKDEIPILLAAAKGHKRMTRYLFSQTSIKDKFMSSFDGRLLFKRCISAEIFALRPPAFLNGQSIEIVSHDESADEEAGTNTLANRRTTHRLRRIFRSMVSALGPVKPSCRLFGQFTTSILRILPGSVKIYEMKLNHYLVHAVLEWLSKVISKWDETDPLMSSAYNFMLLAAKYGITELIDSLRLANPGLLTWGMNDNKKSVLAQAICHRQEKVFQRVLEIQRRQKEILISHIDLYGNNMLHLAADLGPSSYLNRMSNPALQMQRELQWFKAVERIVPPKYKEAKNIYGMTPHEVFTKKHEDLMKAGEQWARDTANSFTLVGTLIVTIMFAAAFTVPGGNNQNNGIPIFLKRPAFLVFIIADTISLVMSSSSVLIFIEILTLRYAMKDFLKSLHRILWGLFTLFFSVTSMMFTFVAVLSLMFEEYPIAIVAASLLASIPVLVLIHTLLRLSFEILKSTRWTPESG